MPGVGFEPLAVLSNVQIWKMPAMNNVNYISDKTTLLKRHYWASMHLLPAF